MTNYISNITTQVKSLDILPTQNTPDLSIISSTFIRIFLKKQKQQ